MRAECLAQSMLLDLIILMTSVTVHKLIYKIHDEGEIYDQQLIQLRSFGDRNTDLKTNDSTEDLNPTRLGLSQLTD